MISVFKAMDEQDIGEELKNLRPHILKIDDDVIKVTTWKDFLCELIQYYIKNDSKNIETINSLRNGRKHRLITETSVKRPPKVDGYRRTVVIEEGYPVYCAIYEVKNAREILNLCRRISSQLGNENHIEIYCHKRIYYHWGTRYDWKK